MTQPYQCGPLNPRQAKRSGPVPYPVVLLGQGKNLGSADSSRSNCQFGFNSVLIGLDILAFFLNIASVGGLSGRLLDERQKSLLSVHQVISIP